MVQIVPEVRSSSVRFQRIPVILGRGAYRRNPAGVIWVRQARVRAKSKHVPPSQAQRIELVPPRGKAAGTAQDEEEKQTGPRGECAAAKS